MSILLIALGAILGFNLVVIGTLMVMYLRETRRHALANPGMHVAEPAGRRRGTVAVRSV